MGGKVDPETGEVHWEFLIPPDEQRRFYGAHPPDSLRGLRCTPVSVPGYRFDGHGEPVNAVFALACSCGSNLFAAGGWVDAEHNIGPPVSLSCDECDKDYEIFDDLRDGYDSLMRTDPMSRELGYPDDFPGVEPPYEVIVRFEYPSEQLGAEEWKGREHNAFSWFTLLVRPPGAELTLLVDCECA